MARIKTEDIVITRSMIDPKDGKVELISTDGKNTRIRRWPIDAKEIVLQGHYKLAAEPQRSESVTNQNTEPETQPEPEVSASEEKKPEPEEEFDYDIPATAPAQK